MADQKAAKKKEGSQFDLLCLDDQENVHKKLRGQLSEVPLQPDRIAKLVIDMQQSARNYGIELRAVGPHSVGEALKSFSETMSVPLLLHRR